MPPEKNMVMIHRVMYTFRPFKSFLLRGYPVSTSTTRDRMEPKNVMYRVFP